MVTTVPIEILIRFWAKTTHDKDRYPKAYHPLLCHLIDVAIVTLVMWKEVLPKAVKERIARSLGLPTDDDGLDLAGRIVAWIAGLHDLGKASPPFTHRPTTQNIHQLYDGTRFAKTREPEPAKSASLPPAPAIA